MRDVIIVGGGPAGVTAGIYAVRAGLNALLLERGLIGGQVITTDMLANYPGFPSGVGGPELMMKFEKQATQLGLEIGYEDVLRMELDGSVKRVHTGSGILEAKSVILAMGAQRKRLGLPNEESLVGRGISYCATCDGAFHRGKRVAVVGGGNTAAEDALYLAQGSEVLLIHRRGTMRAQLKHIQAIEANPHIQKQWFTVVESAERLNGELRLTLRDTRDGSTCPETVSALFIAIGTMPESALIEGQLPTDSEGYILAGEDTSTSLPGVYVAGDLRAKPLKQVVTAISDGAVAASMAARYIMGER